MKIKYDINFVKKVIDTYTKVKKIALIGSGNHSDVFVINDEIVIKMQKHKIASECLK